MAEANPILGQVDRPPGNPKSSEALSAVKAAIEEGTAKRVENIKRLEEGARQSKLATEIIVQSVKDMTLADQIVNLVKGPAGLEMQNNIIKGYEAAGGIDYQIALMRQLEEDSKRVQDLLDKRQAVVDREPTGIQFIDSIINAFGSVNTELQIDSAQAQRTQTVSDIEAISAGTESINRAQKLTRKDITSATLEANYKKLVAASNMKAAEAELSNITTNANAATAVMQANQAVTDNLVSAYSLEGDEENRAAAREQRAFEREQMIEMRTQWIEGREARKVELAASELALTTARATNSSNISAAIARNGQAIRDFNNQVALEKQVTVAGQAGQALMGIPVEEPEMILRGLTSTSPETRDKYEMLIEIGGSQSMSIGNSPADALSNYNAVRPSGAIPDTRANRVLKEVQALQIEAFSKNPATTPKTEEGVKKDFNNRALAYMTAMAQDIKTGDASNPFIGAPFSVLSENPGIRSTALYKNALEAKNMQELNPEAILDTALAAILAKTISPEQAANGIATIFKVASNKNNADNGGFRKVGLPNQTSYNVTLLRPNTTFESVLSYGEAGVKSLFGIYLGASVMDKFKEEGEELLVNKVNRATFDRYETVNLMDQTAVQLYLVKLLSAQAPAANSTKAQQQAPADISNIR